MPAPAVRAVSTSDPVQVVVVRPPQGIEERLREAMGPLRKVQGFVNAAVTRRDGLVIHHTFPNARAAAGLSAMAAAMTGASRATGAELGIGLPEYGFIYFQEAILLMKDAGPQAILACVLKLGSNIGYVITRISRVAEQIREALEDL